MALAEIIYDTAANWSFNNPILEAGQIGVESDVRNGVQTGTAQAKMGDGVTRWDALDYWEPRIGQVVAYKPASTDRTTDNPTADPDLVVSVVAGAYKVSADLFWIFGADNAVITWDGGSATIEANATSLQQWAVASTDDTTPALLFTYLSNGGSGETDFDFSNAGDVYWQSRGTVVFTTSGTFALKWGGLNGDQVHTLRVGSNLILTRL